MIGAAVEIKARRYLRDGKVTVLEATPGRIRAEVTGSDPETYRVTWTPTIGWHCTCPATAACSHQLAVAMVTVRPHDREPADG